MPKRFIQSGTRHGGTILLAVVASLIVYYALTQPRVEVGAGHPYDAETYFQMAQQVARGEPVSELRPFVTRLALPWLAGSLFPGDVMLGFTILNLLFSLSGLVLLWLYLREFFANGILIGALLLLFVASPDSPFRFLWFIPAYTDPPALFFICLLLWLGRRWPTPSLRNSLLIGAIGLVGALFREIVLCAVLVVVFTRSAALLPRPPFLRIESLRAVALGLVPVLATLAGLVLAASLVTETGGYRFTAQIRDVAIQLAQQLSIYPLAWLTAFGVAPLVILLTLNRRLLSFLGANQDVLLYLGGMALLAALAGFHTDRLVFWSYPALLVLIGKSLETVAISDRGSTRKMLFFAALVLVQILAFRALLPLPGDESGELFDPGEAPLLLFTVYGEEANLGHLYASSMLAGDRVVLLIQFCVAAIGLGLLLHVPQRWTTRKTET